MEPVSGLLAISLLCSSYVMAATPVSEIVRLQPFTTLRITGPINVFIDGQSSQGYFQLLGNLAAMRRVKIQLKQGVLYLGVNFYYPSQMSQGLTVRLSAPSLKQLYYSGSGTLNGRHLSGGPLTLVSSGTGPINLQGQSLELRYLRATGSGITTISGIQSRQLDIDTRASGRIELHGKIGLQHVNYSGQGGLTVDRVDSPYIRVVGDGQGRITLAGMAKTLDVDLKGQTSLEAKRLYTQRGFIKTSDRAHVDILPSKMLAAHANNQSTIYYSQDAYYTGAYTSTTGLIGRTTTGRPWPAFIHG